MICGRISTRWDSSTRWKAKLLLWTRFIQLQLLFSLSSLQYAPDFPSFRVSPDILSKSHLLRGTGFHLLSGDWNWCWRQSRWPGRGGLGVKLSSWEPDRKNWSFGASKICKSVGDFTSIYMYIYIYIYNYLHTYIYIYMFVYMYTYIYMYIYICIQCIYICIYIHQFCLFFASWKVDQICQVLVCDDMLGMHGRQGLSYPRFFFSLLFGFGIFENIKIL